MAARWGCGLIFALNGMHEIVQPCSLLGGWGRVRAAGVLGASCTRFSESEPPSSLQVVLSEYYLRHGRSVGSIYLLRFVVVVAVVSHCLPPSHPWW
jgi:hypothetical protein